MSIISPNLPLGRYQVFSPLKSRCENSVVSVAGEGWFAVLVWSFRAKFYINWSNEFVR